MEFNGKVDKKSAAGALFWKALERVFSQGINLVIQVVLARILLPEHFGGLAIMVSIINYAAIFVQAGLATAIVQKEDLNAKDISTVLTASLAVALMMYLGLFGVSPLIAKLYEMPDLIWPLRTLSLVLFLNAINSVQTAILSRKMKFRQLFFRSAVAIPLSGAVGITMAYLNFGLWALVAQQLSNMLTVVIIMSLDKELRFPLRFYSSRARSIYSFSGKILLTSLTSGLHDILRTMSIGKKYSTVDLAYYDKANTYSFYVIQIVSNSVSSVLLPVLSRYQSAPAELKRMARRSVRLSAFVMFPVFLGVAAVAEPLVRILLTDKWLESVPYLIIFCFLRIPGCIITVDRQAYYALGHSGIILKYELGLFVLNLTALSIAIQHSVMAIAVCATLVEYAGSIYLSFVSAKVYDYRIPERLADITLPAINALLMAIIVKGLETVVSLPMLPLLVLQILTGVVSYVVLAWITKDENFTYCLKLLKSFIKR